MKKTKSFFLLLLNLFLIGITPNTFSQNVNVAILQAEYNNDGVFFVYPMNGTFRVVWKKDQPTVSLEANTVLLKIVFAPEIGYNTAETFALPDGWQIQGTPTSNGITLVNSTSFSTEEEVAVEIPVKATATRSTTLPLAGAFIQNDGGDWSNSSAEWELSTVATVADNPLPVNLMSFTVTETENRALLKWKTSGEINAARFEIEMSLDGRKFTKIGEVEANGAINQITDYLYPDTDYPKMGQVIYYRLRLVDLDGSYSYSKIISSKKGKVFFGPKVYPNPIPKDQEVIVEFTDPTGEILVTDLMGRNLGVPVRRLTPYKSGFGVHMLSSGIYFVRVESVYGTATQKLVIE